MESLKNGSHDLPFLKNKMFIRNHAKPRVLMLIDMYGWAFHKVAKSMAQQLNMYDVDIIPSSKNPHFSHYDLLHVFGTFPHCQEARCPVLKSYYNTNPSIRSEPIKDLFEESANNAVAITAPIISMQEELRSYDINVPVYLLPEVVDTHRFTTASSPIGPLKVGWAGNPARAYKRFYMAQCACHNLVDFYTATGTLHDEDMINFYQNVDIILSTSELGEGCPRPILEGMSCGAFPVSFYVGVTPEIVTHKKNGFLIKDETIPAIREALTWCNNHIEYIRSQREMNHAYMQEIRDTKTIGPTIIDIYTSILSA